MENGKRMPGSWHEDGGSDSFPSKAGCQSALEWRTLKLEEKLQEEKFGKEVARGKA